MAVTTQNSVEYAAHVAGTQIALQKDAKLRVKEFNFTQAGAGDANSLVRLVKLPPGSVRLHLALSRVANSAFGAARTLDIGWEAYNQPDGTAVAASEAGLDAAQDVSAAISYAPVGTVGGAEIIDLSSRDGVVIVAKVEAGTIPDLATLKGAFVFTYN